MLKKLFKNKKDEESISIVAPVDGKLVPLEEVPDPVFSQKMMGEGIAIKPDNGVIVSPIQGTIKQLFPTKHAIGIQALNGAEILIHIGLETVELKGKGFTLHVQEGVTVNRGQKLITFDGETMQEQGKNMITPIIITNADDMGDSRSEEHTSELQSRGQLVCRLLL